LPDGPPWYQLPVNSRAAAADGVGRERRRENRDVGAPVYRRSSQGQADGWVQDDLPAHPTTVICGLRPAGVYPFVSISSPPPPRLATPQPTASPGCGVSQCRGSRTRCLQPADGVFGAFTAHRLVAVGIHLLQESHDAAGVLPTARRGRRHRRVRVSHLRVRALCAERRSRFASALSVSRSAAAVASMVPSVAG
jgi:hypothetical protein